MSAVRASGGDLWLGGVRLEELVLRSGFATPTYVYDLGGIASNARALHEAFEGEDHRVAYALKANSAGPIVRALRAEGCGADVVSEGELAVALGCGVPRGAVVFSGVAKTNSEIDIALAEEVTLQAESIEELGRIEARAREVGCCAQVSLRVNPALTMSTLSTHRHIATGHDHAKFGISLDDIPAAVDQVTRSAWFVWVGVGMHIGSQIAEIKPYHDASRVLFSLVRDLRAKHHPSLRFVSVGGGFGIDYHGQKALAKPADVVHALRALQKREGVSDLRLQVEPGRALVAEHGVLLAKVVQTKVTQKGGRWLFLDAGMNDLMRPALYQAYHRIVSLHGETLTSAPLWRVAGPVCESTDDFGEHPFEEPPGWVAILDAGAYGYTMASEYNGRPMPGEVFVRQGEIESMCLRQPVSVWAQGRLSLVCESVHDPYSSGQKDLIFCDPLLHYVQ